MKKFAVHHSPDAPIPGDADNMSFQRMVDYSLEKAEREPINKVSEFFIRLRVKMIHRWSSTPPSSSSTTSKRFMPAPSAAR